ncbi:hypothetical protein WOLCODRAFT_133189 [Wolfiporia cocos MD-104 SS10]|uniref:CCZ1/INTU/HSP4 first Longin domain-containing protein n=1 Tax=Wolfiporia cocos (strain MD-104) TaxID=742152 RepID=A0A2H3K2K5_WOLCO|nr:hypothetical protein WOLCODRAFT_133189 [Wolfiporia cocos MD-104 SS10]
MSRIPPALLYLTIFNPTLRPTTALSPDDEDAEEQAHILFYTARERAVSRDRILRQVGLAKALINFTELFDTNRACENVHSQSRRMIMVSPEPNFWIHACLEVAKSPRPPPSKNKGKDKNQHPNDLAMNQEVIYDYHESSIMDSALRAHILAGYEEFKLTHGSFTSILAADGQQTLELQLERFFTVWAWKWDIEEDTDLASYIGVPLHPLSQALTHILDEFVLEPDGICVFVLAPPYVIPSSRYAASRFPPTFARHMMSRIPPTPLPTPAPTDNTTSPFTVKDTHGDPSRPGRSSNHGSSAASPSNEKPPNDASVAAPSTFAIMPSVSLGMDMRSLRWGWPGYWAFGRGSSTKPSSVPPTPSSPSSNPPDAPTSPQQEQHEELASHAEKHEQMAHKRREVDVDTESLQEAISTQYIHSPAEQQVPPMTSPALQRRTASPSQITRSGSTTSAVSLPTSGSRPQSVVASRSSSRPGTASSFVSPSGSGLQLHMTGALASPKPPSVFLPTTVHLADTADGTKTHRKRVWHLTRGPFTFGLVAEDRSSPAFLETSVKVDAILAEISKIITEHEKKCGCSLFVLYQAHAHSVYSGLEISIPTASKILQPRDAHVVAANGFTFSSSMEFSPSSEHLFDAQQLFQNESDIYEVFSRMQSPQHWFLAKRGLGDGKNLHDGQAYMEIARKESTITDVDNALSAVVRKFVEQG